MFATNPSAMFPSASPIIPSAFSTGHTSVGGNHAVMPNANQYYYEQKYVSIHSEDRDMMKYPQAAQFSIQLPQDYLNVVSARLYSWSFPSNYSVFSVTNNNQFFTFKFTTNIYKPVNSLPYLREYPYSISIMNAIYAALTSNPDYEYLATIEEGFYNPEQMATELTNQMNYAVTNYIREYMSANGVSEEDIQTFLSGGGYTYFRVAYHNVELTLWFGNQCDQFEMTNSSSAFWNSKAGIMQHCGTANRRLPEETNWGLPYFLGFGRSNVTAQPDTDVVPPRFFYTNTNNGYWIMPAYSNSTIYYFQAPRKINFMGPAYMYMEIDGMNCIDETAPYNLSKFTTQTNQTNGIANSSFAKLAIPTTPISQWFDVQSAPYKYYNPPAERIRDLNIRIRYHNGKLVDFGAFDFSFMLELNILRPQMERGYSVRDASSLAQLQNSLSSV